MGCCPIELSSDAIGGELVMKTFEHGGKIWQATSDLGLTVDQIDDFSANINPLVDQKKIIEWSADCWSRALHYPPHDYRRLRAVIADYHAVAPEQVVVDNGATGLIDSIVRALAVRRGHLTAPTFGEYEKALNAIGAKVEVAKTAADFSIDLKKMAAAAQPGEIVFICSPNNPTGRVCPPTDLIDFLERLPATTYCLIDESFMPFYERGEAASLAGQIERFDNLIVLRSATKCFGMPGLRLGYALIGNAELRAKLARRLPIWRVNAIAEQVAFNAFKDKSFLVQTRHYIAVQRNYLTDQLTALGFIVYPSAANYLLFKCPRPVDLYHLLYQSGIIIRRCQNYRGLDESYYRIAVKSAAANRRLIKALKTIKEQTFD